MYWYTAGPLPQEMYAKYKGIGSQVADVFNNLFLSGKFFAFFSFLFGLSFYLQMRGLESNPRKFTARYAWRLFLLLLIGLVHHALWMGDILSIYAPLGFLLLFLRKLSNRWVVISGIVLALNVPGKIISLIQIISGVQPKGFADFATLGNEYQKVITSGGWFDLLKFNMQNLSTKFDFQVVSGRIYITLGFFLLGMYAGRKKWFETPEASKAVIKKICKRSASLMSIALVLGLGMFIGDMVLKLGWQQNQVAGFIFMILYDVMNAAMVVFFVSGLTLLMYRAKWQNILYPLAPVGKMALTSYITQTVFGLLLFYHVGADVFGKTSPGTNFLMAISFFILQVLFSKWWLRYFNFGVLEWLWRSGTLLKWQPLMKKKQYQEVILKPAPAVPQEALLPE